MRKRNTNQRTKTLNKHRCKPVCSLDTHGFLPNTDKCLEWHRRLKQYMVLLESQMHFCRMQRVWRRLHCLWDCSLYEKGGSAHGFPLLIFPMIPCLTLRGLDSALPLAEPNYSPVSIALFDSSSGVLSCLRVCSRVPHVCGTLRPPHHPPYRHHHCQASENPEPAVAEKKGQRTPFAKDNQDKSKKKKKDRRKKTALPCWPSACLFVWQHNLWLSLRYCWSQANSLHRKSGSQEQAIIQAGRKKMLQGKVLKKGKGRWEDSETEKKKNDNKRWESRGGRAQADTVKAGDGKWQERRELKKQKQKKVGIKKGRHVNKRLWWRQACRTKNQTHWKRRKCLRNVAWLLILSVIAWFNLHYNQIHWKCKHISNCV